jgi:predicted peptidase
MKKIFLFLVLGLSTLQAHAVDNLKSYNVDLSAITISGISSGAFMANQMSIAYSKTFAGSASIAGGIYWCAQGNSQKAQGECMTTTANIRPEVQIAEAQRLAQTHEIDPLENLAHQKLYIYASPKDTIIKPPSSDKLYEFSKKFIPENQIKYETSVESAHGFPTLSYGSSCAFGFLPWILKCNFDGAGEIFKTMYSNLEARGTMDAKNLFSFSQSEFGSASTPLFANGWIYVPKACQDGEKCKLHVALHGCQMNPDFIQDQFAKDAGYNEWAETNHIIVLYPQSAKLGQSNPYACWDWFGFTGANYVTQSGAQMKALKAMIDRITN